MPPPGRSLAATRSAAAGNTSRHLVMLHGIYGRGRNWQGIARALTAARPEYACWLVDLPHHGDSGPARHGASVRGFAADVDDWLRERGIAPDVILGHSYGGKVALALAGSRPEQPLQAWIIDSTPEMKAPSGSAWRMLQIVRDLPDRFAAREEAVAGIVAGGFPPAVAQWMATNLERADGGFAWRLDFDVMEALLVDFFGADLWPVVERPPARHEIHFLKATASDAISAGAAARIAAAAPGRVYLHHREGGHWIHAESPQVVVDLLLRQLP